MAYDVEALRVEGVEDMRCTCVMCLEKKKKKIFCNATCAAAAGKNLGELIEFNLVQQASCNRLEFFFLILYFND